MLAMLTIPKGLPESNHIHLAPDRWHDNAEWIELTLATERSKQLHFG